MLAELFRMKVQGFNPLRPIKDGATALYLMSSMGLYVSILSAQLRTEQLK